MHTKHLRMGLNEISETEQAKYYMASSRYFKNLIS